jgi:hypothetical protein
MFRFDTVSKRNVAFYSSLVVRERKTKLKISTLLYRIDKKERTGNIRFFMNESKKSIFRS